MRLSYLLLLEIPQRLRIQNLPHGSLSNEAQVTSVLPCFGEAGPGCYSYITCHFLKHKNTPTVSCIYCITAVIIITFDSEIYIYAPG